MQNEILAAFPDGLKGVIFDCDGVLVNSQRSNDTYYNIIREGIGMPPMTREESNYVHQSTVMQAFEYLFPAPYDQMAREFSKTVDYGKSIIPTLILEDGLLEILHWLKHWDIKTAICTNRTESIKQILHYFSLESFFSPVKYALNTTPKPSPAGILEILEEWNLPAHTVAFLGDSPVDAQAAKAAGVPLWAFRNTELEADLHTDGFHPLMKVIEPLVEKK